MTANKERINPRTTFNRCMFCPGGCELHQVLEKVKNLTTRTKLDQLLKNSPGVTIDSVGTTASTVVFTAPYEAMNKAVAEVTYYLVCSREPYGISGHVCYPISADEATEVIESNRSQINSHARFRRISR